MNQYILLRLTVIGITLMRNQQTAINDKVLVNHKSTGSQYLSTIVTFTHIII